MKLNFLTQIRISFCPLWSTPAVREFVQRSATKKAIASNPKCEVSVKVLEPKGLTPIADKVEVAFTDGSKEEIFPVAGFKVEDIISIIKQKSDALELAADFAEMKANPVSGPMPIKFWKGRRHTYVRYAATEEKSKRAAGGVKTIKKK
mmetsp:Transcript_6467/g.16294  ORF Transcript_6467/g.16294 Transcript_6467/m.16294 type:complete len:148 (-) Transcript_6467:311-754(-)